MKAATEKQRRERERIGLDPDGPQIILRRSKALGFWGSVFARSMVWCFAASLIAAPFIAARLAWNAARSPDFFSVAVFALVAVTWVWPRHVPMWEAVPSSSVFFWWRSFFDFTIVSESPSLARQDEPSRPYLLAEGPHGLFPTGAWLEQTLVHAIAIDGDAVERQVYGSRRIYAAVADAITLLPWWRVIFGFMGATSASRGNLERIFRRSFNACLYPGGVAEFAIPDRPNTENLYLKSRKGFLRLALQQGVDVVPVFHFGSSQAFRQLHWGPLGYLSRKLRFSLFILIPWVFQQRVVGVLGRPIRIERVANPSQEQVDELHRHFISEIERIFENYKHTIGWQSHKLAVW